MAKLKPDFQATLYILAGCLLMMFPAFVNGYPLIYSDTSTYIHSAFEFLPPKDRPITYGLIYKADQSQWTDHVDCGILSNPHFIGFTLLLDQKKYGIRSAESRFKVCTNHPCIITGWSCLGYLISITRYLYPDHGAGGPASC